MIANFVSLFPSSVKPYDGIRSVFVTLPPLLLRLYKIFISPYTLHVAARQNLLALG